MAGGLTSVSPNITDASLENLKTSISSGSISGSLSGVIAASLGQGVARTTSISTAAAGLTSTTLQGGAGLTGIASDLASNLSGGFTGTLSSLGSSLSVLGAASALASSLSSLGGASTSSFTGWPQIPAAAKGLPENGPPAPPNFNLGPAGNINLADQLGGISQIFGNALSAMQLPFSGLFSQ